MVFTSLFRKFPFLLSCLFGMLYIGMPAANAFPAKNEPILEPKAKVSYLSEVIPILQRRSRICTGTDNPDPVYSSVASCNMNFIEAYLPDQSWFGRDGIGYCESIVDSEGFVVEYSCSCDAPKLTAFCILRDLNAPQSFCPEGTSSVESKPCQISPATITGLKVSGVFSVALLGDIAHFADLEMAYDKYEYINPRMLSSSICDVLVRSKGWEELQNELNNTCSHMPAVLQQVGGRSTPIMCCEDNVPMPKNPAGQ